MAEYIAKYTLRLKHRGKFPYEVREETLTAPNDLAAIQEAIDMKKRLDKKVKEWADKGWERAWWYKLNSVRKKGSNRDIPIPG